MRYRCGACARKCGMRTAAAAVLLVAACAHVQAPRGRVLHGDNDASVAERRVAADANSAAIDDDGQKSGAFFGEVGDALEHATLRRVGEPASCPRGATPGPSMLRAALHDSVASGMAQVLSMACAAPPARGAARERAHLVQRVHSCGSHAATPCRLLRGRGRRRRVHAVLPPRDAADAAAAAAPAVRI